MKQAEEQIRDFMLKAGQECPDKPTIPDLQIRILRAKLILEEAFETIDALGIRVDLETTEEGDMFDITDTKFVTAKFDKSWRHGDIDLVQIADGCADLKVVTIGCEVACGIPSDKTWNEVHRSNMTKFIDGHKRADGKWQKGPSFQLPNLEQFLDA